MVTKFFRLGLNWSRIPCWHTNNSTFLTISLHISTFVCVTNRSKPDHIFMRFTVGPDESYLIDILCHLVDLFCSRHFPSSLGYPLPLCALFVLSFPPVVQGPKRYSRQKSPEREQKIQMQWVMTHKSRCFYIKSNYLCLSVSGWNH